MDVPLWLSGTVTLVSLVGLGIFVYPWLLKKRGGVVLTTLATLVLAVVYWAFDSQNTVNPFVSAALGLLWAVAPVIAAAIVLRTQRPQKTQGESDAV